MEVKTMISVKNLVKKYGKLVAVDNINLQIDPGKITVLLGPNGAGKSSTLKSIAGLLNYKGEIIVNDYDHQDLRAKRKFAYVAETPMLYDALTVNEHLRFVLKAYQLDENQAQIDDLLATYHMKEHQHKLAKELSKGMSQKLSFLCALIIEPDTLIVDEPLLGLDPSAIEQLMQTLVDLKHAGKTILLSTHIIDMIEDIYDEAYIMDHGKIVNHVIKDDSTNSLKSIYFESVGNETWERSGI